MEPKKIIGKIILGYPIIYGGSMMATYLFCMIFDRNATFSLDYFGYMFLFALVGDLPSLVFCSKRKLSKKEWNIRLLLHFILLETVLLVFAGILGMYHTLTEGIFFFVLVMAVYVMVRGLAFAGDILEVKKINAKLRERKLESKNSETEV
ncbi:MAG: DUF3021 family protein [Lachnospiraceae bacterium]|nr:DUF3021 family protein [Lachnospiraceae bacterium]